MKTSHRHYRIDFIEFGAANVEDLKRSREFYEAVFGWSYKEWGDDYVDTQDSGVGTGINADPSHRPAHPLVVMYANDLEAARAEVVAHAGVVTREIFSFPGGRRFHFRDPAGHELAVWSDR